MKATDLEPILPVMERQRCPTHPGAALKEFYLDEIPVSITEFSADIGVSRKAVSAIVNARKSITAEMAMRIAKATVTSPQLWLNLQANYDLWHVAHEKRSLLESIRPIAATL